MQSIGDLECNQYSDRIAMYAMNFITLKQQDLLHDYTYYKKWWDYLDLDEKEIHCAVDHIEGIEVIEKNRFLSSVIIILLLITLQFINAKIPSIDETTIKIIAGEFKIFQRMNPITEKFQKIQNDHVKLVKETQISTNEYSLDFTGLHRHTQKDHFLLDYT